MDEDEIERERRRLNREKSIINDSIDNVESKIDSLEEQIEELENKIELYQDMNKDVSKAIQQLQDSKKEIVNAENAYKKAYSSNEGKKKAKQFDNIELDIDREIKGLNSKVIERSKAKIQKFKNELNEKIEEKRNKERHLQDLYDERRSIKWQLNNL